MAQLVTNKHKERQPRKHLRFVESAANDESFSIAPEPDNDYLERLKNTVGSDNLHVGLLLLNQFAKALPLAQDLESLNQISALLASLEPQDPLEGMLLQQMTTCHLLHLEATRKAFTADYSNVRQSYMKQAMQLAKTYAQLLDTLTKKRNKGNQHITVQHVTVADGGQAIVGNLHR